MSDDIFYTMKRGWMQHPAFMPSDPFSRAQAFEWLVSRACMGTTQIDIAGKTVTLERGQLCMSYRALAEAWNWDLGKVQRFIARMKTDTLIDTESANGRLTLTICNYEDFDVRKSSRPIATDTLSDTATIQERYAVDTQNKKKDNDNNYARAREEIRAEAATVTDGVADPPPPCPPKRDPNDHALIQSFDNAIVQVFGPERQRPNTNYTDEIWASRILDEAGKAKIPPEKAIELLTNHFVEGCQKLRQKGDEPPKVLKFFVQSASKVIRSYASDRDAPPPERVPFNGSGGHRPRHSNGADAPTAVTAEKPWQRVHRALVDAHLFAQAREVTAASAVGEEKANEVAAALEVRHLAKKHGTAARAA